MNIQQRINAAMKEVHGVEKTERNAHANYNFAGGAAINAAIRPALVKHGIVQTVSVTECKVLEHGCVYLMARIRWACADTPESYIESDIPSVQPSQTSKGTVTAQQVGQALTYATKNMQLKCLMLTDSSEADSDSLPIEPRRLEDSDSGSSLLEQLLERFSLAGTSQDVADISALVRDSWESFRAIKGAGERLNKARQAAYDRLKAAT